MRILSRLLAAAAGGSAFGVEAFRELGDLLLEAVGDGGEVLLVAGDQARVGLGGEGVGKGESAGRAVHDERVWGRTGVLPQAPACAIR